MIISGSRLPFWIFLGRSRLHASIIVDAQEDFYGGEVLVLGDDWCLKWSEKCLLVARCRPVGLPHLMFVHGSPQNHQKDP